MAAGAMSFAVVGCGNDDDDGAPGNGREPTSTPSNDNGNGEQREGDRVRVAFGAEPTTVDAHDSTAGTDNFYMNQIYSSLMEFDQSGQLSPGLTEEFEVSPDGLQITLHLREGVTFHNGDPFTADDVVYSADRIHSEESRSGAVEYTAVERWEALDEHTFVWHMNRPDAGFILNGFGRPLLIVPQRYTEEVGKDEFGRNPIGTGPYKLASRDIGTGASLERFDEYFLGRAPFRTVEMRVVPDATARVQMLQVGEVDVIAAIPPAQVDTVNGFSDGRVIVQPANTDTYFAYPLKEYEGVPKTEFQQIMDDKRVRQALNYAVDKAGIASSIYGELARPYAITNPDQPFHLARYYEHNPERARELLSEAGASDLTVEQYGLAPGRLPGLESLMPAVASNLRDVGIQVNEHAEEFNAWLNRLYADIQPYPENGISFSWASTAGGPNPFRGAESKWYCRSRPGHWCDEEFERIMFQAQETVFDEEERNELLREAFEYMYEEAPGLWLILIDDAYGFRPSVVSDWRPRAEFNPVIRLYDLIPA